MVIVGPRRVAGEGRPGAPAHEGGGLATGLADVTSDLAPLEGAGFWFDGGMVHLGTGGAITWDSQPDGECDETVLAARRLLALASETAAAPAAGQR